MKLAQIKSKFFGGAGDVFKSMATLTIGVGFAKLLGAISMPILARLYAPTDFGVMVVFVSIIAILTPLVSLRYVLAIPLPTKDGAAFNVMVLSLGLIACIGGFIAFILLFWGDELLELLSLRQLIPYKWLIILGVLGAAVYESFSLWATRKRSYKIIAKTAGLQGLFGSLAKIGLGLIALQPVGLLIGHVVAISSGATNLIVRFYSDVRAYRRQISWFRLKVVAQKYRDFPIYRLPSQILLVLSVQAPALFAAALYGIEKTGQFGLALMVLSFPIGLIGNAAGQAFYGEIARFRKGSESQIRQLAFVVQKRLLILGVPPTIGICFLAESVFGWIFGEQWILAGQYASVLAPFLLMQLTSAPLVQVLNVFDSQKSFLIMNIVRILGLLLIFLSCSFFNLAMGSYVQLLAVFLFCFYLFISLYILVFLNLQTKVATARQ